MSENRSLAVLEVLVHLSGMLPDKYLLGAVHIPDNLTIEKIGEEDLPLKWSTLSSAEQFATKRLGDAWVERRQSAVLSVPSVIVGERNYILNPGHRDFARIEFTEPEPFQFDLRLVSERGPARTGRIAHGGPL